MIALSYIFVQLWHVQTLHTYTGISASQMALNIHRWAVSLVRFPWKACVIIIHPRGKTTSHSVASVRRWVHAWRPFCHCSISKLIVFSPSRCDYCEPEDEKMHLFASFSSYQTALCVLFVVVFRGYCLIRGKTIAGNRF